MTSNNNFFSSRTLKNKFSTMKKILYDDVESKTFKDISDKWTKFLESDKSRTMVKNSFIVWCLGGRGSGKTSNLFKQIPKLLQNPKRNVAFWKTPHELVSNIEQYCPEELKGRFRTIDRLREIRQDDIFVIDEGLIGANAKEALKTEMRELIKFLSKSRHLNIIAYINSVSFGILKEFRNVIDIVIYKRLTRMLVENNKHLDLILMEFGNRLKNLKEWEAILISTYKRFENEGYISMDLKDHCPWFNDEISMYHKNVSADLLFDDAEKTRREHQNLVEWIISLVRDRYYEVKGGWRMFRMWLYTDHTTVYYDHKTHLKTIYELYCYYWDSGLARADTGMTDSETNHIADLEKLINSSAILFNWEDIEHKAINRTLKSGKNREKRERDINIYKERNIYKADELIAKYEVSEQTVYKSLRRIKGAWDQRRSTYEIYSVNYHKGMIFESDFAKFLKSLKFFDKVVRNGKVGEPDIVAYKDEKEYIFSLKNRDLSHKLRSVVMTPKDFAPEIKECHKNDGTPRYMFVAVLNNDNNKVFCFYHDYNNEKNVDLKKIMSKYI